MFYGTGGICEKMRVADISSVNVSGVADLRQWLLILLYSWIVVSCTIIGPDISYMTVVILVK